MIFLKTMSIFQNMICGTSQMDAAVLVIAATDGVMAQTRVGTIVICQHALGLAELNLFILFWQHLKPI